MSAPGGLLRRLREDPLVHWVGTIVAIALGVGLATVHWLGLVAGGALVGLVATSLKRGLLAGLGFGVFVLSTWFLYLATQGLLGKVLATGQFFAIAVLIGLLAPLLGSLVRGVV